MKAPSNVIQTVPQIGKGDERLTAIILAFALAYASLLLWKKIREINKLRRKQREATMYSQLTLPQFKDHFSIKPHIGDEER